MDMLERPTARRDRTPQPAAAIAAAPATTRLALPPAAAGCPRSRYVPVFDAATGKVRLEISWTW